jgi:hypothetical protein
MDHCGWLVIETEWVCGRDERPRESRESCESKLTQPIPDDCWHLSIEDMADDTSGRAGYGWADKGYESMQADWRNSR